MSDLSVNTDSVHCLITDLCRCITTQYGPRSHSLVSRLKRRAFEVLLSQTKRSLTNHDTEVEPHRALGAQVFEAKLNVGFNPKRRNELDAADILLDSIEHLEYFTEGAGREVLHFLLLLQNKIDGQNVKTTMLPRLLVPGPFTLYADFRSSKYYPKNAMCLADLSSPKYFKSVTDLRKCYNPYVPKFFTSGDYGTLDDLEHKYLISNQQCEDLDMTATFTGITQNLWGNTMRISTKSFSLFSGLRKRPKQPAIEGKTLDNKQSVSQVQSEAVKACDGKRIFSWNWETFNELGILCEKPFMSEANCTLDLQSVQRQCRGTEFEAKVVTQSQFVRDIKSLAVGIQSDLFYHDESFVFHIQSNITIEGVTPSSLENFIGDFLECGTCYKRLQMMIAKRDYKLMYEGFVFKALCSAIDECLVTFRQLVFSKHEIYAIQFYERIKKMMKQIVNLSFTLAIHPKVEANVKPPIGSQFLGYLYQEILRLTEGDCITLLVFILRRCCHIYFRHLQNWIFQGVLDDPCNELFVGFVDHYRENTKYFYDKAYFIRKESVPGFFLTFEDHILQCGKYTMLLKLHKPNHPLFRLECPSLTVCLTFEEIERLEETCADYYRRALEVCGEPITIRSIYQTHMESKRNFYRIASQRSRENMEKWANEQKQLAKEVTERKRLLLEELRTQLHENNARRLKDRYDVIEVELKHMKDAEIMDEQHLMAENASLRKRIEEMSVNTAGGGHVLIPDNVSLRTGTGSHTNRSSTGTDFESCCDDDDVMSAYDECLVMEYMEKRSDDFLSLHSYKNALNNDSAPREDDIVVGVGMKRSASDYINSNDLPENASALQRNRQKAMSGAEIEACQRITLTAGDSTQRKTMMADTERPALTEAQRNKLKVMCTEYNIPLPDINLNVLPNSELTELERNRRRIMQSNSFDELPATTEAPPDRKHLNLNLETERSRNRRRVLESQYDLFTGKSANTLAPLSKDVTPMSITSDTVFSSDEKDDDFKDTIIETLSIVDNNNGDVATDEEPAFHDTSDSEETSVNSSDPPKECDNKEEDNSYQRCRELLESNFHCASRSPYFRLNNGDALYSDQKMTTSATTTTTTKSVNLRGMSVITLTEFLRKSTIIPMKARLKIVNDEVMRLFLQDLLLLGHFKSLRNYFFLMNGEFGALICDGIIGQLENGASPHKLLNYQMLHSILENALGSSIIGNDKNADNLSFIFSELPKEFDLTSPSVLDTLRLSYSTNWPLNLVLNPETLQQYANIFKYLLKVRRISWVLERVYESLKAALKQHGSTILKSPQYRHVQMMRHKFYHFVYTLQNHIIANALQASWKTFKDDLLSARSIEDVYRRHTTYIKRILFLCMMNKSSSEFYNTIENIFRISLRFCISLRSQDFRLCTDNEHYTHPCYEQLIADELEFDKFIKYTIHVGNKIVRRGYQEEIGEFISLLNFNYYYIARET